MGFPLFPFSPSWLHFAASLCPGRKTCYNHFKKFFVAFGAFHSSYIQKGVRAVNQALIYSWYEQYKNGIFRYVLSITRDPYLAEDILHDTFVKVLSGGIQCSPGKEQAWLYRVARNLCYDRLRRKKREREHVPVPDAPDNRYEYIELISSLSPKDREIVTLKIALGLTHAEIAAILGISPKASQKRYERAIAELRKKED